MPGRLSLVACILVSWIAGLDGFLIMKQPLLAKTRISRSSALPRQDSRYSARSAALPNLRTRISLQPSVRLVASAGEKTQTKDDALTLLDVTVIGGGPAGLAISAELCSRGLKVACVDPVLDKNFVPNYGLWLDELEPYGMLEVCRTTWPVATVYLGLEGDKKQILDRPYGRLDVRKAKQFFLKKCEAGNVRFEQASVTDIEHMDTSSVVSYADPTGKDGKIRSRVVVDATGHKKAFVKFQDGREPGYQAAYGIEADIVDGSYPFSVNEMLLMDWRDNHLAPGSPEAEESEKFPTFIYCMPTNTSRVFFEETSLVANPPIPFEDLKRRMYERLEAWGTKVTHVHEEEFCLIPMGGQFPVVPQRIIGFGGSSVLVHPATGYMFANTIRLAVETADEIDKAIRKHPEDPERISEVVWKALWAEPRRRQRDFFQFGGEYLESIGLQELREFFGSFFVLPYQQWSDFLSFRLIEPYERLVFGLGVFANTSWRVRMSLGLKGFLSGPEGWWKLGRSVLAVEDYDDKVFPTKESRPDFFEMGRKK